jgi:hypothetical protein
LGHFQNQSLPVFPDLEVLFLTDVDLSKGNFPELSNFPKLKVLSLSGTGIQDNEIQQLAAAGLPLRYLNLRKLEGVTESSESEIAKLGTLKYIHIGLQNLRLDEIQSALPDCEVVNGD